MYCSFNIKRVPEIQGIFDFQGSRMSHSAINYCRGERFVFNPGHTLEIYRNSNYFR